MKFEFNWPSGFRRCLKLLTDGRQSHWYTISSPMSLRLRWATKSVDDNKTKNYPACKDQWQTPQQWYPLWVSFSGKLPNNSNLYGISLSGKLPSSCILYGHSSLSLWYVKNLDIKSILFHVHCHISTPLPLNKLEPSIRTVQTLQVGMCVQGRFKSVCASTQSEETLDPLLPIERLSNAQADQSSMGPHVNLHLLLGTGSYGIEMPGYEIVDML